MAASGNAVGLSDTDVEHIREALAAGRRPKVVFTASAGQISGQVGQVIGLTDPKASDEWVVVRFGKDELPFSPADLAVPVRGSSKRRTESAPTPPSPEFKLDTKVPGPRARAVPAKSAPKATAVVAEPAPAKQNGAAVKPAARRATAKIPAPLTVTLSYADREWTVAARLGSKVLAKPYGIKPAEALRMVSLLDVPGLHDAVESIIAAERVEAEDQARRLRAELAEIEARLAELTGRA
jgi:hypothetical protein